MKYHIKFVKAINVVGEKMAGNTCKMAISYLCHFRFETEFIEFLHLFCQRLLRPAHVIFLKTG